MPTHLSARHAARIPPPRGADAVLHHHVQRARRQQHARQHAAPLKLFRQQVVGRLRQIPPGLSAVDVCRVRSVFGSDDTQTPICPCMNHAQSTPRHSHCCISCSAVPRMILPRNVSGVLVTRCGTLGKCPANHLFL